MRGREDVLDMHGELNAAEGSVSCIRPPPIPRPVHTDMVEAIRGLAREVEPALP